MESTSANPPGFGELNQGRERVKTSDLSPAQKVTIYEQYEVEAHNFRSDIEIKTALELRGIDVAKTSFRTRGVPCVVAFRESMNAPAVFVGPRIGPAQTDAKGKSVPPRQDIVKVQFNLDTQTPNIEITTQRGGNGASDAVLSGRITVHNLEWPAPDGPDVMCGGLTKESRTDIEFLNTNKEFPSTADTDELRRLHEKGELFEIIVHLKSDAPLHWAGLSTTSFEEINNRRIDSDVLPDSENSTAFSDALVQGFHRVRHSQNPTVTFYLRINPGVERMKYLLRMFNMCRNGGFWFYRKQTDRVDKVEFPEKELVVPRWMVTEWEFDCHYDDRGQRSFSNPRPYLWDGHRLPPNWPNANEGAFLLKLGVYHERIRAARNLKELCQSDRFPFTGRFEQVEGFDGYHICKIHIDDDSLAYHADVKMPAPGTRLQIQIETSPDSLINLRGAVVNSYLEDDCEFMCVVTGRKHIQADVHFPLRVDYIVDDLPYKRQMESIQKIQSIEEKPSGVDMKAVFFNDEPSAPHQSYLADKIDQGKFLAIVAKSLKQPNKTQLEAVKACVAADSGLSLVQGPPGTGKTETLNIIARAMLGCGVNTLVCSSTNASIKKLAETFDRSAKAGGWLPEHEYILFSGAYVRIEDAVKLKRNMEISKSLEGPDRAASQQDIDVMRNAENIAQEHARSMLGDRSKTPEYELTFGCKLKKAIKRWAADTTQEIHEKARQYQQMHSSLLSTAKENRRKLLDALADCEYDLGVWYLRHEIKAVFCTPSSSAHELLSTAFQPEEIIIDEAAQESLASLATPCGAYKDTAKHITLVGDQKQGRPIFAAATSNLGHKQLSRSLFEEESESKRRVHRFVLLNESYRCVPELLDFTRFFYNNLVSAEGAEKMDIPLQNTIKLFWTQYLRSNFKGSLLQVAIDVNCTHRNVKKTTTLQNLAEADMIADIVVAMLNFTPGNDGRAIMPSNLVALTPYTGQVFALRSAFLKKKDSRLLEVRISCVAQSKGLEWNIVLFSSVISVGGKRLEADDKFPIKFVADPTNINVAMSRARIGRFIVGGLYTMAQMAVGHHTTVLYNKSSAWFSHLKTLATTDNIVTDMELRHRFEQGAAPKSRDIKRLRFRLAASAHLNTKRKRDSTGEE
ncbi:hypothetical protein E8E13_000662 [Curvularia kusanoi]|uniref:Uncharacterized protein n=1 Tax=Curvularia kusanoi TaxID=90978 RepID=A0A9P4T4G7_CURKU|nr:hypothetical protein E8E13_000662 [Curvularia kusanoi]